MMKSSLAKRWSFDMEEEMEMLDLAQRFVNALIKKAANIYFNQRMGSFDTEFDFLADLEASNPAPTNKDGTGTSPTKTPQGKDAKVKGQKGQCKPCPTADGTQRTTNRFLHYDRGVPVFVNTLGKTVYANTSQRRPHRRVPGSPYEMKMIRFNATKIDPIKPQRSRGQDGEVVVGQSNKEMMRGVKAVMKGVHMVPRQAFLDNYVFNAFVICARTKANKKGKRFGVGVFPLTKEKHRKSIREFQQYNLIKQMKSKKAMASVPLATRKMPETFSETGSPDCDGMSYFKRPACVEKPTFAFSKDGCNKHPLGYSMKKPTPSKGHSVKTVIADRMFSPGKKGTRPVRGFRTWPLVPPTHRTSSHLMTNRDSFCVAEAESDQDEETAVTSTLAYHEPLQLLHGEGRKEPNQIYLLMNARGSKNSYDVRYNREPVALRTVSVPRTGRIKLTALPYELDDPNYFDDRREAPPPPRHHKLRRPKFNIVLPVLCLSLC